MKKIVFFILKFSIAAGLLYWIIYSGKLDIKQTSIIWERKVFFALLVLPMLFFCMLLQNFRWWLILHCFAIHISYRQSFFLTWIGNFFNTVLPGLVSGDILKGVYLQKKKPTAWLQVYGSLLLDRFIGLLGLLFLFLCSSLKFGLENKIFLQQNLFFIIVGLLGLGVFVFLIFFANSWKLFIQKLFPNFFQKKIFQLFFQFFSIFSEHKKKIFVCFLLSVIIHSIICLLIYQISTFLFSNTLDFWKQALIIPLGLVVTAIPISPAGIGVGHIAFDNLYAWFGFHGGATLFNIFIINQIFIFLTGAIPFIFYKKNN